MKSSLEQEFVLHLPEGDKPWFEGQYVHVRAKEISLAIIFGLQISNAKKNAFTQFLDTHTKKSRYVEYPWKIVTMQQHPFVLSTGGNRLSINSVTLRPLQLQANLLHNSLTLLHTSPYAPTIMGPFSYVSMECARSIISPRHTASGTIRLNSRCFQIHDSGYMEKDRGAPFPSAYA